MATTAETLKVELLEKFMLEKGYTKELLEIKEKVIRETTTK